MYTTIQGDTFDQIALKTYGSDLAVRDMMAAAGTDDPELLIVWRFPYGVELPTPDLTPETSTVAALPVWRRGE